jgi:hypothetical protein
MWDMLSLYFVFSFFFCLDVNSGALVPRRSTAHREGRGFLLSRVLFLIILLVVYVFVVYISLLDDGR